MGTVVEFSRGELVIVGGDYGSLVLAGTTPEARFACEQIVGAARLGGDGTFIDAVIALVDDPQTQLPLGHAGREGTPERGPDVGPDAANDEGRIAESAGDGPAARDP